MAETKIRKIYEMMFPYGFYNKQLGEKELFTKEVLMSAYGDYQPFLKKPSHADFILRLVDMILNDKIMVATGPPEDYRMLRWDDIC